MKTDSFTAHPPGTHIFLFKASHLPLWWWAKALEIEKFSGSESTLFYLSFQDLKNKNQKKQERLRDNVQVGMVETERKRIFTKHIYIRTHIYIYMFFANKHAKTTEFIKHREAQEMCIWWIKSWPGTVQAHSTLWPRRRYLIFLSLSFFICKI